MKCPTIVLNPPSRSGLALAGALALISALLPGPALQASVLVWNSAARDNNWANPGNWIGGQTPGPTDDAEFPAGVGAIYVYSVVEIGGLTLPSSATLNVLGTNASFLAHGAAVIDGASLYAGNGGQLRIEGAIAYSAAAQTNGYPVWQADGPGSVLALDAVQGYAGSSYPWYSRVLATSGGHTTLAGGFAVTGGLVQISATGTNSLLEAPGLRQLAPNGMSVESHQGARLSLRNLGGFDGSNPDPDNGNTAWSSTDPGSVVEVAGLTNFLATGFPWGTQWTVTGGGALSFAGAFDISEGNLYFRIDGTNSTLEAPNLGALRPEGFGLSVADGAQVSLPGLSEWSAANLRQGDAYWTVNGPGSSLSLPSLAACDGSPLDYLTRFYAQAGATFQIGGGFDLADGAWALVAQDAGSVLDVVGLRRVTGEVAVFSASADGGSRLSLNGLEDFSISTAVGNPTFECSGAGGLLEMTALTNFSGTPRPSTTYLTAQGGGALTLGGAFGILDGRVSLTADGTNSALAAPGLRRIAAVDAELTVRHGAAMTLPDLAAYSGSNSWFGQVTWAAFDPGSRLELPSLTSFAGSPSPNYTLVAAYGGARVDLGGELGVTTGAVSFLSQGDGSLLSAPTLRRLAPTGLGIYAEAGGRVSFLGLHDHNGAGSLNGERFESNGTNSVLELDGLTNFVASLIPEQTGMSALNGGLLSVGGSFAISGGALNLYASAPGSTLTMPGLVGFTPEQGGLDAEAGGRISLPRLAQYSASHTGGNGITWQANGPGSTIEAPALVSFAGTHSPAYLYLTASAGGLLNLGSVVNFVGQNLNCSATGAGSVLDLHSATTVDAQGLGLTASGGGTVDLRSAVGLAGPNTYLVANGAGSTLNLSAAAIFDIRNSGGGVQAINGGSILLPSVFLLRGSSITGVDAWGPPPANTLNGADAILFAQLNLSVLVEMRPAGDPAAPWREVGAVAVLTNQIDLHAMFKNLPIGVDLRVSPYAPDPPELQIGRGSAGIPLITVFGMASASYELDSSPLPLTAPVWSPASAVTLSNTFAQLPATWATNDIGFIRARRTSP